MMPFFETVGVWSSYIPTIIFRLFSILLNIDFLNDKLRDDLCKKLKSFFGPVMNLKRSNITRTNVTIYNQEEQE